MGQSARIYREAFAGATIYSFEPASETYKTLSKSFENSDDVIPVRAALGAHVGEAHIAIGERSTTNYLLRDSDFELANSGLFARSEVVTVLTVDRFCEDKFIKNVGYLKIDTEGHDLEVLKRAVKNQKFRN